MATIRKKGDYQWHCQIRRQGYPTQTRTFETRDDAEKWARDVERAMDRGTFVDRREADKNTLRQVLERYLKDVTPGHKGKDVEELRIKALTRDRIADFKMSALSAAALADYIERRSKEVSQATVRREIDILSAVITKARRAWGINLAENPVTLIERPKPAKARDRRLQDDEEARILAVLEANDDRRNPWIGPFFRFALETAMRRGELLALEWQNVDLQARTAHLPDTKNGEARTVPLSSRAANVLKGLLKREDGVSALPKGKVFPITADAVKKAWQRAMRTARKAYEDECLVAGKEPDPDFLAGLRVHDLRHEATSRIAEKLDNILELSAVTGHKDIRMLKRYYHPRAEDLAKKLG